jgi:ComF family protein
METKSWLISILDFVLPPYCGICRKPLNVGEKSVCQVCFNRIEVITSPFCERCGKPSLSTVCSECILYPHKFTRARALGKYQGVLKSLILLFKERRKLSIGKKLALLLSHIIKTDELMRDADLLTPVPLYPVVERQRGYNQSKILAQEISLYTGIPVAYILSQVKPTKPQKSFSTSYLSKEEQRRLRVLNVKGVFRANNSVVHNKKIIIIDDVLTTGATLNECAEELYNAGASKVYAAVIARAA